MTGQTIHPFVRHLQDLANKQDRGALAALRRGLGKPPGVVADMYRYVEPFMSQRRSTKQELAYYLIASLFAFHPNSTSTGNMGTHMAKARTESGSDSLERRFMVLLAAHPNDLPNYLRQSISFLRSKGIPVNWNQLFWDLQDWDDENRLVQKKWARAFWSRSQTEASPEETLDEK